MALRLDQAVRTTQRWVKFRGEMGMEPRVYYLPPRNLKYDSLEEKRTKQDETSQLYRKGN